MKNLSNYVTTGTGRVHGWWPAGCTTGYNFICEVPFSSYQCPPSPPQAPAPPPDIYACEQANKAVEAARPAPMPECQSCHAMPCHAWNMMETCIDNGVLVSKGLAASTPSQELVSRNTLVTQQQCLNLVR
jgi:hypothetical protein